MNLLFAWRYFKSKKSTNAINIIAWIGVVAMLVGTAALIIVLSVFNGFEGLVKSLYGDFYPKIQVSPATGKYLRFDSSLKKKISEIPGVQAVSYSVEEKALLVNNEYQTIVFLKGVDSSYSEVNNLATHTIRGQYSLGTADMPRLYCGAGVANAAGANPEAPFSNLVIYLPNRQAGSFTSLDAMLSYEVSTSGIFAVQQEFDDKYAFTNLPFMQFMLGLEDDTYSAAGISILPGISEKTVKKDLENLLDDAYQVQTMYELNQSLFTIMQVEKWIIYAILSIILVVAAFNIIGALSMLVLEKEKDMAVLQALGATPARIQDIFLKEGLLLSGIGGLTGMLLAFIICWLQQTFHLILLGGGSFVINYYPVSMKWIDFILVGATVVIVTLLASWIPARKAALRQYSLKS
jgi:lipoprotein-releasing system permease protein